MPETVADRFLTARGDDSRILAWCRAARTRPVIIAKYRRSGRGVETERRRRAVSEGMLRGARDGAGTGVGNGYLRASGQRGAAA